MMTYRKVLYEIKAVITNYQSALDNSKSNVIMSSGDKVNFCRNPWFVQGVTYSGQHNIIRDFTVCMRNTMYKVNVVDLPFLKWIV